MDVIDKQDLDPRNTEIISISVLNVIHLVARYF